MKFRPITGSLRQICHSRLHKDSIWSHAHLCGLHQTHITIDAAAGIPAGVRLLRIVHTHGNHILGIPFKKMRYVIAEGYISIRTHAEADAVDKNFRIHIYTVKLQAPQLAAVLRWCKKRLPVPADTARQRAAAHSGRILRAEVAFYCPVMRKFETAPSGVVI